MRCFALLCISSAALLPLALGACHNYERDYYEELGCKLQSQGPDGCATSYDCSSLNKRNKDQCYYRGREYNRGYKLETSNDSATSCLAECRCAGQEEASEFSCVSIECPELFNKPPDEGCYRTFEHGKCCSVGEVCRDEASQKTTKTKCEYMGQTFHEGQKFYPDEEPCLQCICLSGFNGSLVEPFCQKVHCNLELLDGEHILEGCAPIFYGENGCCPIDWRCPEKNDYMDSLIPTSNLKGTLTTDKTCQFGNLTLAVGQSLGTSPERPMSCVCRVPPHLVCIQKEYED